ncbi:MAG: helix-turn-helix transcriptional regulator [Prevotella sp.]|nr:helix-turn-helix transcriptional regulator [Prevotella sp.]
MNIKEVIKSHGWTLERLAAEMTNKNGGKGISQPSVSSIVNGNPTIDKLQEIATIIGISVSELVSDETDSRTSTLRCPHCGKEIQVEIK